MGDLLLAFSAFAGAFLGYFVAAWLDRQVHRPPQRRARPMTDFTP